MIEPAIREILTGDTEVARLVDDRVYFIAAPQNEQRARVVLVFVSQLPGHIHDGKAGYVEGRVQIDCLATNYREARELFEAVRQALDNYAGVADSTEIAYVELEESRDLELAPYEGQATPPGGVQADAVFLYLE